MDVLLIWNNGQKTDMKVLVRMHTRYLQNQIPRLIAAGREAEAFRLLVKKAEVRSFIPPGQKFSVRPRFTLVEDFLAEK
ncbi:MAG: hypothetical protein HQL23_07415 [Candidatus Omnitrophica bacterium]|nr:hypothetical protein [Candidatus Omnitrophota bacterium]